MSAQPLSVTVTPRQDVLQGALVDAVFAANLDDVVRGQAPPVYGDPTLFFAQTFPSLGLRQMLEAVFGRLSGKRADEAPILRLETSLGGGKTHNLIALFHAASGGIPPADAQRFLEPSLLLDDAPAIGVFVGTSTGATSFPTVSGTTPKTVWGYLALQLGGDVAYAHVRDQDEALTSPGSDDLARVLAHSPRNLILIDELSRYLATAAGVAVAGSTLAKQTVSFLMALMEAVASRDDSCLVLTATGLNDVFGDETAEVVEALQNSSDLISRRARTLRPSEESDLPKILAARLFERVDRTAAENVAETYAESAKHASETGLPLPERMTSGSWRREIQDAFPFHPETVLLLDKRLATIPGFQRTRGALRLLARSVRATWARGEADTAALLHPHHISLREKDTAEDLTSRLDRPRFENVIRADVVSPAGAAPANAQALDSAAGGAPLAERLATTIFLYSLTKDTPGLPEGAALGAVLEPSTDPNRLLKALEDLRDRAWFMHDTAGGLRFTEEVTLKRIVAQHELEVSGSQIEKRAQQLLQDSFKASAFQVHATWSDAKVIDKSDRATLVLFHWNRFGDDRGVADPTGDPFDFIQDTWEKAPDGGIRQFRNRLVLLAPAAERFAPMQAQVRRLVALEALVDDPSALSHLDAEKRQQAHDLRKEAATLARIAVCSLMSVLYVPKGQPPRLEPTLLPVVTQASLRSNQTQAIEDHLAAEHKTLATGDPTPDPALLGTKLGKQLDSGMATQKVLDAFAMRTDLPIILDSGRVREMIRAGVLNGEWEYNDASQSDDGWATKDHGAARTYRIAADTYLHPVGSAPAPPEDSGDEDDTDIDFEDEDDSSTVASAEASGSMQHALDQTLQAVAEKDGVQVAAMRVRIDEQGKEAGVELERLITCLTGPPPPGADVRLQVRVVVDLAGDDDAVKLEFVGSHQEWQPLRQAVHTLTTGRSALIGASVVVRFAAPISHDDQALADVAAQAQNIGPSKATVRLELVPAS